MLDGCVCAAVPPTCAPDEFTCDNSRCLPPFVICDGYNHCGDLSDEVDCGMCTRHDTSQKKLLRKLTHLKKLSSTIK